MMDLPSQYKSRTKPRPHQLREFEEHRDSPARCLSWGMRTGKSKAIIDLAEYLFSIDEIDGLLIVAPNGVHENWVRKELPIHCSTPYEAMAYRASAAGTRWHKAGFFKVVYDKRAPRKLQILTINAESIRTEKGKKHIADFNRGRKGRVLLCVDESHMFRTPGSARTRVIRALAKHIKWKRIMTGTLSSNSVLHVWSQFEILEASALGFSTYGKFKAHHAIVDKKYGAGGRAYETVTGFRNVDELKDKMAKWTSVVTKKDAGIEDLNVVPRAVGMSPKQEKIYKQVEKESMIDDLSLEGASKMTKLQQIAQGWYYDETGQPVDVVKLKDNMLIQAVISEIKYTPGKIIVWCRFNHDIAKVSEAMLAAKINHVIYKGGMTGDEKNRALDKFQSIPATKVFLGQPAAAGTGLPLDVADTIMWHSATFDAIIWEQANERASIVGDKIVDLVTFSVDGTVTDYILRTLKNKEDVARNVAGEGLKRIIEMETLV